MKDAKRIDNATRAHRFACEQRLMRWEDVREAWFRKSGERISRARCWQIAMAAQRKMAKQLKALLRDLDPNDLPEP